MLAVSKILYRRKGLRKHLVPLVLLNGLFWFLAFWNVHEGYVADANGTSGGGWGMPAFALVFLATFGYLIFIIRKYQHSAK